ncbi:uncharacterized protein PGTG_20578 [Puccinia graminis f. sp. tritici CRL 75-36-700-3]|uniref:Uncharacterized protein n=1 Tax=Puccinia graminis f. sp. tritici (strain CRL 75-36-700-3 / race SCCL) TaxID=418459 RepID=H6QP04_PUCGT|nr:uncharacterized protein PGTG_20578 [Puccinia graminis f. sp. tritici CRL 75-36-700-3]EHS62453.1 hypothetical protein PGTG_20578 [Puccinia graminis f. sp. tritici CRL 75-36-700-3]
MVNDNSNQEEENSEDQTERNRKQPTRKESRRITKGHPSGKAKVKTSSLLSRLG